MEIQLYRALLDVGVKEEKASNLVDSFERELRERLKETRTDLATKADVAEVKTSIANVRADIEAAKAEIIKWNVGAIIAAVGLAIAIARLIT